ncbi:MAG: type II secretion system protein GspN, partial [Candidatus Binataceae bacterium]
MNINFSYSGQSSRLPLGAVLQGVRISNALLPNAPPILDNATVSLSPSLTSILLTRPGLNLSAGLYGGSVNAAVRRDGDALDLTFDMTGLELNRYEALIKMGVNVRGRLSGNGAATLSDGNVLLDSGRLNLTISGLTLRLARGLPAMRLGTLTGAAHLSHGILQIDQLKGHGSDLNVEVHGSIQLAADIAESTLNLRVNLMPTRAGRSHLGFLLAMLPHPPNGRPYFLHGLVMAPSIT